MNTGMHPKEKKKYMYYRLDKERLKEGKEGLTMVFR